MDAAGRDHQSPVSAELEEFLAHYESVSGIRIQNRVVVPGAERLQDGGDLPDRFDAVRPGDSDDQRFILNAYGISPLTQLGLAELAIDEKLEDGPVMPRDDRIAQVQSAG